MASSESVKPIGFFTLPRELRDEIYDILHELQDEVAFGIDGQLAVRFPLPRLHQISHQFTEECDSRAPTRPLIVVSQKYGNFQASTCANRRQRLERIGCPRIVNLRHTQSLSPIKRLHINLYAFNATEAAMDRMNNLNRSMNIRLNWVKSFAHDMRSPGTDVNIRTRFMLDDVGDIRLFKLFPKVHSLLRQCNALDIVVDCPSAEDYDEEEFSRAKVLAEWRPGFRWRFDDEEIERCQAIADGRSDWSTAATSPKSSEGEEIGEYQELDGREERSTNERLRED